MFFLSCFLFLWGACLFAQSSVVAGGGSATGTGGSLSFSVGQPAYTFYTNTAGTITQGVQQPWEIFVNVVETKMKTNVSLYPNPTQDFVIINVGNADVKDLSYQLLDAQGKLIASNKIENNETKLSVTNLAYATYFVKILNLNKESKTFKIVKTQ